MTTLEYYWNDGTHTVFDGYTIDENSIVKNIKTGHVMSQHEDNDGYNRVTLRHEGKPRSIFVHRAFASTFIGKPPSLEHTTEHDDRNRGNNVPSNILWKDKSDQAKNRDMPNYNKSAFIIVKDNIELTAKEWIKVVKNLHGKKYTENSIRQFSREQKNGFRYKFFPNLRGEVWKTVPGSKNKKGEWFISNKNRIKYKTPYAENVLTVEQLHKSTGYPVIKINGKDWKCHYLSMMTFRPREYVAKLPGDVILHKNGNKNDFNPFRLRWGTPPENAKDAYNNGKRYITKSGQKPVASYIDGVLEREHESLGDAAKYLRENGYSDAKHQTVSYASENYLVRYGRTWKYV
ncbi:hypothetical protein ATCVOR07043_656R [Acanthocystis turfacea Chlorella virus OR0704.3]|nr:hypothetical protein ATCVOR07043_656R [Acanthocystis turfacea Chlorella virus OR0704.3]